MQVKELAGEKMTEAEELYKELWEKISRLTASYEEKIKNAKLKE